MSDAHFAIALAEVMADDPATAFEMIRSQRTTIVELRKSLGALTDPATWDAVAVQIGHHPYTYDLSDSSHLLDVVQIVCEAAAKALGK